MGKLLKPTLVAIFLVLPDNAGKPVDESGVPFGNGFPIGKHYNLNIIGKKDNFSCPPPSYDEATGEQIYGNVIFMPREQGDEPITVLWSPARRALRARRTLLNYRLRTGVPSVFPIIWRTKEMQLF